jgi:hypothetical protein
MFRFSIRELMLVVLIAAVGVSWWIDRSQLAHDAAQFKEPLMKLRRMRFDVGHMLDSPELSKELNATWEAEHAARKSAKSIAR